MTSDEQDWRQQQLAGGGGGGGSRTEAGAEDEDEVKTRKPQKFRASVVCVWVGVLETRLIYTTTSSGQNGKA
jgi:hypothetical protein